MAAEAIVSAILQQLLSILDRELEQEVRLVVGVRKEIKKLTSNFRAIHAVLLDAQQRQVKERAVRVWLDKLKDASYDMDDVLDEWNTAIIKLQIEGAEKSIGPRKKVCFFFPSPIFCFKQVGLRRDIAIKIREINENFNLIAKEKDMYNLDKTTIEEHARFKSSSFVDVSEIFGRNKEKHDIIGKLLSDYREKGQGLHVISIIGMGGIGKTTLAQLAYNNEEVIKKFDKRIWVCVSKIFDEIRIVKAIIEGLTDSVCNFVELQSLLKYIHESVAKKKFLLILDDVWIEGYNWGPLYNCLSNGLQGSKILITTRKETVSHTMKSSDIIEVEGLIEEESWPLFKKLAFFNRTKQECEELEKIGKDIVGKCKGLPLAIKIVGSLLCSKKTKQQWQRILNNEFRNLQELETSLFPLLSLSYNDLPLREKRCFLFCGIFPKNYDIDKNELIQLWMTQGYLGLEQSEDMEIIGQDCFDNLVMHSFFQKFEKDFYGTIIKIWKMHDIVHDFAQFLAKNECFTMEINSSEAKSPSFSDVKARHLVLILNNKEAQFPSNIGSAQKLRSLLIKGQDYNRLSMETELILPDIFEKLTCLRALELSKVRPSQQEHVNKMIPREIGKLIHIRYLNMSFLEIKEIPETLCDLYNLQTLNLSGCNSLEKLPQGMGKLINLRHLITCDCDKLSYMPKGIEDLTRLRTLSEFVLGGGDVEGSQVCSLGSLQNLKHLGGKISLKGLGNVGDSAEAKRAQLENKKNLLGLDMFFGGPGEASASETQKDGAVLEALLPPLNLERLYIAYYRGTRFPEWMMWLTQLKSLQFTDCIKCEQLPGLGKLPLLESLDIFRMESVKRVGNEFFGIPNATTSSSSYSFIAFPKLKFLRLSGMRDWEDWDDENTRQITIMPSLSSLTVSYCPKLKALPKYILHASLNYGYIFGCPKLKKLPSSFNVIQESDEFTSDSGEITVIQD